MIVELINKFSHKFLNKILLNFNVTDNIAFGGPSLYILLGAISVATRGRVQEQIYSLLNYGFYGLSDPKNPTHTDSAERWLYYRRSIEFLLESNSVLYHSTRITPYYTGITKRVFNIESNLIDFQTSGHLVNKWVERKTHGLCGDLLIGPWRTPSQFEVMMVFINAFIFHEDWARPFEKLPHPEIFVDDKGRKLSVTMMVQKGIYRYFEENINAFQFIFIPFAKKDLFAAIFLPRETVNLKSFIKDFNWNSVFRFFQYSQLHNVRVKIPKLKILSRLNIAETLQNFEIQAPFHAMISDFSGMTNQRGFIANLTQVSNFIVDESGPRDYNPNLNKGPEIKSNETIFDANRPFLFLVYSSYLRLILLTVVVTNPNAE
ncbi:Serpin I2 [Thelohanellus kitauei]|uniref:Serpin I2 n=1 Tax=Thelohanellus kitauei TaxID=669202 RepID=A0A0C2IR79_THEKT|nr:Serpin I2 [Thelohanellus kitauei]